MVAYAEHEFRLNAVGKDGKSLRQTLETVARQRGGRMPAEGINPHELHEVAVPVWDVFQVLRHERTEGAAGPLPLTSRHFLDWMRLERVLLEPWQIDAIRQLDLLDLATRAKTKG